MNRLNLGDILRRAFSRMNLSRFSSAPEERSTTGSSRICALRTSITSSSFFMADDPIITSSGEWSSILSRSIFSHVIISVLSSRILRILFIFRETAASFRMSIYPVFHNQSVRVNYQTCCKTASRARRMPLRGAFKGLRPFYPLKALDFEQVYSIHTIFFYTSISSNCRSISAPLFTAAFAVSESSGLMPIIFSYFTPMPRKITELQKS